MEEEEEACFSRIWKHNRNVLILMKTLGLLFYKQRKKYTWISPLFVYHCFVLILMWGKVCYVFTIYEKKEPFGPTLLTKIYYHFFHLQCAVSITTCTMFSLKKAQLIQKLCICQQEVYNATEITCKKRGNTAIGLSFLYIVCSVGLFSYIMSVAPKYFMTEMFLYPSAGMRMSFSDYLKVIIFSIAYLQSILIWCMSFAFIVLICLDVKYMFQHLAMEMDSDIRDNNMKMDRDIRDNNMKMDSDICDNNMKMDSGVRGSNMTVGSSNARMSLSTNSEDDENVRLNHVETSLLNKSDLKKSSDVESEQSFLKPNTPRIIDLEYFRSRYEHLNELVRKTDDIVSLYMVSVYVTNILCVCMILYTIMLGTSINKNSEDLFHYKQSALATFLFSGLLQVFVVTGTATHLTESVRVHPYIQFNPFSAGTAFTRQNLTSVDVRF